MGRLNKSRIRCTERLRRECTRVRHLLSNPHALGYALAEGAAVLDSYARDGDGLLHGPRARGAKGGVLRQELDAAVRDAREVRADALAAARLCAGED